MGKRTKPQSLWPGTAGGALASVAMVVTLLVPLDPSVRNWVVRGLLIALALGVFAGIVARGQVAPTKSDRAERIAFQAVFFWGFFTGLTSAMQVFGEMDPPDAVISGAIAGILFGAGLLVLDPWVVQRSGARSSPHLSPTEGQESESDSP